MALFYQFWILRAPALTFIKDRSGYSSKSHKKNTSTTWGWVITEVSFLGELLLEHSINFSFTFTVSMPSPGSDKQTAVCLWRNSITVTTVALVEVEVCSQQQAVTEEAPLCSSRPHAASVYWLVPSYQNINHGLLIDGFLLCSDCPWEQWAFTWSGDARELWPFRNNNTTLFH